MPHAKDIDEYIARYPADVQAILQEWRAIIHQAAPEAEEAISYDMPTFVQHGGMIAFAAWKKHIAMYTCPVGTPEFQKEIEPYKAARSTLQFPLNKPMPYALIRQAVGFKVREHLASVAEKSNQT